MAALQSIRKRGTLLAVIIGVALLAFILGDFLNSGNALFGQSQYEMGKINGQTISYQEFSNKVNQKENFYRIAFNRSSLDGETTDQIREQAWEEIIREKGIGQNIKNLGIQCTGDELLNMINTGNVTPMIRQAFTNQNGQYDPQLAKTYISSNSTESNFIWQCMEDELKATREYIKYISLVASGLYVTNSEVEQEFAERTHITDIKYVNIPYTSIKDEDVSVSDKDLKAFFEQNAKRFDTQQETRDIAYVSFDVVASDKDSADAKKIVDDLKNTFESTDEIENFVTRNSDIPYQNIHYSKGEILNKTVDSVMFNSLEGIVYGPYIEGEYYKMARLIKKEMLSDSVKVSHILIAHRTQGDTMPARLKADSLMSVIKSGIDFGALAMQFSDDQASAADSGNLGWITERINFIPEFKDACFSTAKGQITTVSTQYGVHIIKVLDKTAPKQKVSVGFLQIEIRPGKETRQAAYMAATQFAGANNKPSEFEQTVQANNLVRRVAPNLTSNTRVIPGIENSRELVRWAFDNEKSKTVSDVMEFGDRYIVAALVGIHRQGLAKYESVKEFIRPEVTNNKKAEKIIADIKSKNADNVDAVAAQTGQTVKTAANVNFGASQIAGVGFEPAVIAAAAALPKDGVSSPIQGRTGVFVIENTSYTPSQEIQQINYNTDRTQLQNDLRSRASYQAVDAVNKTFNIEDNRVKFF